MSSLTLKSAALDKLQKVTISFWVKQIDSNWGKEKPLKIEQPEIHGSGKAARVSGGSYHPYYPQLTPPHMAVYPQKEERTYDSETIPFITFGPGGLGFKRCVWESRDIGEYYLFQPGLVGMYHLFSQFPVPDDSAATPAPPTGPQTQIAGREGEETTPPETSAPVAPLQPADPNAPDRSEKAEGGEKNIVPLTMIGSQQGRLKIILQTDLKAKLTGFAWAQEKTERVQVMTPIGPLNLGPTLDVAGILSTPWADAYVDFSTSPPHGPPQPWMQGKAIYYADVSDLECGGHPEAFIMEPGVQMNDNQWHHILLSWEMAGKIEAEATGPAGTPPYPGPYGQYSGPQGDIALGFAGGAPFEDVGKYGYATGGRITSGCKAWLMVDGQPYTGKSLNHEEAYSNAERYSAGAVFDDDHCIAPPNAFLVFKAEIRRDMATSLTGWERTYRTMLGGFTGPQAKIQATQELRRMDYAYPKFELQPTGIAGSPLTIGNQSIAMAELQIWVGKTYTSEDKSPFIDENGRPADMKKAEKILGKPQVRLHGTGNWKAGFNTGTLGVLVTGEGASKKKERIPGGSFTPSGTIKRYLPDPKLDGDGGGQPPPPPAAGGGGAEPRPPPGGGGGNIRGPSGGQLA